MKLKCDRFDGGSEISLLVWSTEIYDKRIINFNKIVNVYQRIKSVTLTKT